MNKAIRSAAIAALLVVASAALASDATLKVGSPAPALTIAKWIKGTPVKSFEKGKVYVVEFWATWCGPCKVSIPHLTELAKKYKGKATFIGVSVSENRSEKEPRDQPFYEKKVADFVKEWGAKMEYTVAIDNIAKGDMYTAWLKASNAPGIPNAYVVDQTGTVAWIGHPMGDLDRVVGEVIEGRFDRAAEAKRQADAAAAQEAMMAKFKPMNDAMRAKDYAKAVAEMDKLVADDPKLEMQIAFPKYEALLQSDPTAGYAWGRKLATGIFKDEANALNSIAWFVVDDAGPVKNGDFAFAAEIAQMGVDVAKDDITKAFVLDTLAYAQFKGGQIDKAIASQEKAVKLAETTKNFPADTKKEMVDRLAMFKSKKGN